MTWIPRSRTVMLNIHLLLPALLLGRFLSAAPAPEKPTILVLPAQADSGRIETPLALAAQRIVEEVCLLHPGLEVRQLSTEGLYEDPAELAAWVQGGPPPAAIIDDPPDYWVVPRLSLAPASTVTEARLELHATNGGGLSQKTVEWDAPHFGLFRQGVIEFIERAGGPWPMAEKERALWEEQLPAASLEILGRALGEGLQGWDAGEWLEPAVEQAPESYLLLCELGWTHYGGKRDGKARISFQAALQIQPSGACATEGLRSLDEADTGADATSEAFALIAEGQALLEQSQPGKAISPLEAAVESLVKVGDTEAAAVTLQALGLARARSDRHEAAVAAYQEALRLIEDESLPIHVETILSLLGDSLLELNRVEEALAALELALPLHREEGEPLAEAATLRSLALGNWKAGKEAEGSSYAHRALEIYERNQAAPQLADALKRFGFAAGDRGDHPLAIQYFQRAAALYERMKEPSQNADVLVGWGSSLKSLSRFSEALSTHQHALRIYRELGNAPAQAAALRNIGDVLLAIGEAESAEASYKEALELVMGTGEERPEASALNSLATLKSSQGRYEEALRLQRRALSIWKRLDDKPGLLTALNNIGSTLLDMGRYDEAGRYFEEVLADGRRDGDKDSEGRALNNLANVHRLRGDYRRALSYFEQALPVMQSLGDRAAQATVLNNLGECHQGLGRLDLAMEYFQRALQLQREIGFPEGEATTLNNLATLYVSLGQSSQAEPLFRACLEQLHRLGRRADEAVVLGNLGVLLAEDQLATKEDLLRQSLAIQREVGSPAGEAAALDNLAFVLHQKGEHEAAVAHWRQALEILTRIGGRPGIASAMNNLGECHASRHLWREAADYLHRGLLIGQETGLLDLQADSLSRLMEMWGDAGAEDLAIFHGKQAVQLYERIRSQLKPLDQTLQRGFVRSREDTYRRLAGLLVSRSRLIEAQQVMGLLKEQEYLQFVRRGEDDSNTGGAELTPREDGFEQRWREIAGRVTQLGQERGRLLAKEDWTPDEERRLSELDEALGVAEEAFQKFLDQLHEEMKGSPESDRVNRLEEERGLMEELRELGEGTVALYTVSSPSRLSVVLMTPDVRKAFSTDLGSPQLSALVYQMRTALTDPLSDPLPPAQALYDHLVRPLEKDLESIGAKTLIWSLDGSLRYIPVAALHDGRHYLVERFENVLYTPAGKTRLMASTPSHPRMLALGVSKEFAGLPALPSVVEELDSIVRESEEDLQGVVSGDIRLDQEFTQQSMRSSTLRRYPWLHIASHFVFHPGDETDSFLLMGDGSRFNLAQIRRLPNLFGGVDLLSLSACDTASGGRRADGRELEGFAVLAQRQGAKSVLATLWQVEDVSTAYAMQKFYELHQEGLNKAEALRKAQLSLLAGDLTASSPGSWDFRHPYFWAPFVLIGNWK